MSDNDTAEFLRDDESVNDFKFTNCNVEHLASAVESTLKVLHLIELGLMPPTLQPWVTYVSAVRILRAVFGTGSSNQQLPDLLRGYLDKQEAAFKAIKPE